MERPSASPGLRPYGASAGTPQRAQSRLLQVFKVLAAVLPGTRSLRRLPENKRLPAVVQVTLHTPQRSLPLCSGTIPLRTCFRNARRSRSTGTFLAYPAPPESHIDFLAQRLREAGSLSAPCLTDRDQLKPVSRPAAAVTAYFCLSEQSADAGACPKTFRKAAGIQHRRARCVLHARPGTMPVSMGSTFRKASQMAACGMTGPVHKTCSNMSARET